MALQIMHKISDVEAVEGGYGFTICDSDETPGLAFVYADEKQARQAAKLMQAAIEPATSVLLVGPP